MSTASVPPTQQEARTAPDSCAQYWQHTYVHASYMRAISVAAFEWPVKGCSGE